MIDFLSAQRKAEEFETEKSFSNKMPDVAIFCTNCGAHLEEGDLFCVECGARVENIYDENVPDSDKNDEKNLLVGKSEKIEETSAKINIKHFQDRLNAINSERSERKSFFLNNLKNSPGMESVFKAKSFLSPSKDSKKTNSSKISDTNKALLGYYVRKKSGIVTETLVITNIDGSKISGKISTRFSEGSFANELFTGTLVGDEINLKIVEYDLHPAPDDVKREWVNDDVVITTASTTITPYHSFSGIISPQKIAGTWIVENGHSAFFTYDKS